MPDYAPIHLLWYDNGLEFDDHERTLLGVYGSRGERERAKEWFRSLGRVWPFRDGGFFIDADGRMDEPLMHTTPSDLAADRVLDEARRLAEGAGSWADVANALFSPGTGLASRAFVTQQERRWFVGTPQYAAIIRILNGLMEKLGLAEGAAPREAR